MTRKYSRLIFRLAGSSRTLRSHAIRRHLLARFLVEESACSYGASDSIQRGRDSLKIYDNGLPNQPDAENLIGFIAADDFRAKRSCNRHRCHVLG